VVVFDPEGDVVFSNDAIEHMFAGDDASTLDSMFPREFTIRFLELARAAAESGECVYRRTIWKGRRVLVSCSMVKQENDSLAVLVLRCDTDLDGGNHADDLGVVDLGALDVLTDRELEILAHIAKGRTAKRIAQTLDLSPKTVEWHRAVIGRKLGQNNRVLLTRMAIQAGLTESDNGQARFRREARRGAPRLG
jgi:DNA-binding CsgD family transcriptional regulator